MSVLPEIETVADIVMRAAQAADLGVLGQKKHSTKNDGSVITEKDMLIQKVIFEEVRRRWPEYAVLGEEMVHADQARIISASQHGLWSLDPLDGTTNFASGFPFYGISLALIIGGMPRLGVVYDPLRDECFTAVREEGAWLNRERLQTPDTRYLNECIANVDFKRLVGRLVERLMRCPPYRSQRNVGASVLEWCWLAAGRFQLYLHGGQHLWDYAAGSLVLAEAGGTARTIDNRPMETRSMAKKSVVAAVNRPLFDDWYDWLKQNMSTPNREARSPFHIEPR